MQNIANTNKSFDVAEKSIAKIYLTDILPDTSMKQHRFTTAVSGIKHRTTSYQWLMLLQFQHIHANCCHL